MSRNITRRNVRNFFKNDPLLADMANGTLKWGNILSNSANKSNKNTTAKNTKSHGSRRSSLNMLEGWDVPNLTKPSGIWENFPVNLVKFNKGDGVERYAIVWNHKNLKEWKNTRSATWDEYMEYQAFAEYRLLHAIRKHSHNYMLEEPVSPDQIVIIRPLNKAVGTNNSSSVPILRRLMDIKTYFPNVVWNEVDGVKGEKTYALTIRSDFMRRLSPIESVRFKGALKDALTASRFWTVLPHHRPAEFCRIQMKHD